MEELTKRLVDKSQEAFIVGIELYNKPTIRYRVEGFSFFICNAWELLLKAHLLKSGKSIYYKDSPERTISLENCIRTIYTNDKDPLRQNLEQIIELRNTSTHFVTEEYEQIYVPLFQACVLNYINKLLEYFDVDITSKLGSNFLTLSVKLSDLSEDQIRARYPAEMADRLIRAMGKIGKAIIMADNEKYAIPVRHDIYITKNKKQASASFTITKDADNAAFILRELHDMQQECPYKQTDCINIIRRRIRKDGIMFVNPCAPSEEKRHLFNSYCFKLFVDFYHFKADEKYCYVYNRNANPNYTYSNRAVNLIFDQIKTDPEHIIQRLRKELKNRS